MAAVGHAARHTATGRREPGWTIVLEQELRDLWLGGRGLVLSFAFSLLLSAIAYLVATNTDLNFLEQRESVNLTLQVAVAVGALLALLAGADAVSGERERGTLESLLLTPVPRSQIATGKLLAALSLWLAAFVITVPYIWFLGRGVGIVGTSLAAGFVVGTLLAVFLGSFGLIISFFAGSNRVSLSVSLLALLVAFAPTQLPSAATSGWAGELLLRLNPITAGEHYIGKIVVNAHPWNEDVSWLISPLVAAVVFAVAVPLLGARYIRLRGGASR
ncbi:MAG TPA: ABC transporter permease subunit [Gaiellaceae bacterium]|jgi:ABC-2 type transport system permease protein